jgi:multiple sugar transport system permease protein
MFNNRFGMINGWLRSLGLPVQPWLTEPQLVFTIIVMMAVWGGMGYYSIIYLVGLKNLPSSYHEAAEIDGANKLQILFRITIPLLTPQIFFVLTMSCIGTFQMFEAILVFGGAAHIRDGIRTVAFGIFERGFTFHQMGYASSNALVLLVMILMVTFLNFIMQKYWVHYDN